jgi:hypothetical protein
MSNEKNIANAKALFAKNKGIKQVFFTNDGQAFEGVEAAKTHQKEITGSVDGLHLIKNGDYEGPTVSITEDVVGAAAPAAEESGAEDTGEKAKGKKEKVDKPADK